MLPCTPINNLGMGGKRERERSGRYERERVVKEVPEFIKKTKKRLKLFNQNAVYK